MFDFSPLQTQHFTLFAASFLGVFLLVAALRSSRALRRSSSTPTVRLAGVILICVVVFISMYVLPHPGLTIGLILAALITLAVGTLDEIKDLSPASQLSVQIIIAFIVTISGWTVRYVSHPFAPGVIHLAWLPLGGVLTLSALVITVVWLVFLMNSLNWLDGVDGLAGSVGTVAFVTLAAVSLLPSTQDGTTLSLAMIGAGSLAAFTLWNWSPARVYLGTSGSWFLGLYLGLVAIIGGGKIATTLLVLAIPALDALAVFVQRVFSGRPPWQGDERRHLHHRLRAAGLSDSSIALLATVVSAAFGAAAVLLQTRHKLVALLTIGIALALLVTALGLRQGKKRLINK